MVEFRTAGKADYVLFDSDDQPAVIIEAKNTGYANLNLLTKNPEYHEEQLARYVNGSKAKVGLLTNGFIWRLYDLDNPRRKLANQLVDPIIDIYQDNAEISNRYIWQAAKTLYTHLNARRFGWH